MASKLILNPLFRRSFSSLPPVAQFTKLSDGTPQDFKNAQVHFSAIGSPEMVAKRLLGLVEGLKGLNIGNLVDLHEHSVQTATRALNDGADEETVVCALLHDIGELLAPICHGEVGNFCVLIEQFSEIIPSRSCTFNKLYLQ